MNYAEGSNYNAYEIEMNELYYTSMNWHDFGINLVDDMEVYHKHGGVLGGKVWVMNPSMEGRPRWPSH